MSYSNAASPRSAASPLALSRSNSAPLFCAKPNIVDSALRRVEPPIPTSIFSKSGAILESKKQSVKSKSESELVRYYFESTSGAEVSNINTVLNKLAMATVRLLFEPLPEFNPSSI